MLGSTLCNGCLHTSSRVCPLVPAQPAGPAGWKPPRAPASHIQVPLSCQHSPENCPSERVTPLLHPRDKVPANWQDAALPDFSDLVQPGPLPLPSSRAQHEGLDASSRARPAPHSCSTPGPAASSQAASSSGMPLLGPPVPLLLEGSSPLPAVRPLLSPLPIPFHLSRSWEENPPWGSHGVSVRVLDPRSGATWALPVQRHRGEWKYPPSGESGGLPEKVLDELFKWLLENSETRLRFLLASPAVGD